VQYDTTKVFKVGGKDVMDIVLDGEIDEIFILEQVVSWLQKRWSEN
jgi:hypothetical protein